MKLKIKFAAVISLFIVIVFYGCDIVQPPYLEQSGQCGYDNLSVPIRKILVEDYTGFKCGNCPEAHELLQQLVNSYCDHIVPVSIHVGYFAKPSVYPPYTTDFRTEDGEEYNEYFGADAAGLPVGMVNRKEFNGSRLLSPDAWPDAIAQELQQPLLLDVQVSNSYDSTNRQVTAKVNVSFLTDLTDELYLNVWLVEDSIIDYQKDYRQDPPDIPNYVHRHVFRAAINSTWGEKILDGNAQQNQVLNFNYTYTLDTAWEAKHCYIVAFVYRAEDKTVLQAEQEPVIK